MKIIQEKTVCIVTDILTNEIHSVCSDLDVVQAVFDKLYVTEEGIFTDQDRSEILYLINEETLIEPLS